MRNIRAGSLVLPVVLLLLSCSDPSGPRTPTSITVVSGGGQSALVTRPLPQPVVVEVKGSDGRPVRGVSVTWNVFQGGGSVSNPTTTTGSDGRTQVQWTLGSAAGQNRLNAAVTGVAPVSITATASTGPPASASIVGGNGQTGLELLPLGEAIVVEVRDEHGNGAQGAAVTFTPTVGVVTPQNVTTDVSGVAAAIWTLGAAGEQNVSVSVAGLAAEPLRFTATALAPGAVTVLGNELDVTALQAGIGENLYYRIPLPANVTHLTVSTVGGTGDVDLFVRRERLPTTAMYACRSITPSANETCRVQLPEAGDWYVLLDAFTAYSGVSVRASYQVGGSMSVGVMGLPAGTDGQLLVTGPGRYERIVRGTTTLSALVPGTYSIAADFVRAADAVYVSDPGRQEATVTTGGTANVSVAYSATSGALNLDIVRAYITQAVQRTDGSVPLVAGRDGLLRVFARGNAVSNAMPAVRARFYNDGALTGTMVIAAPSATLPVSHDERALTSTWNVMVPGSLLQPGTSMLVDVDPDDEVAESDETDNTYPASGTPLLLDVRSATTLQARLVPVVQANGLKADVSDASRNEYVSLARALYPLPDIDVDVRAEYSFSGTLTASYDSTWGRLLSEINQLRVAEAPGRYYYGVIKPAYTQGGTGLAFLSQRAAIGVDWPNWRAETVAHEWGHNFGRLHVDCGNPSGVDPDYPYAAGRIGHHGYDIRSNQIRPLDTHYDLMSYCSPTWSSDYTYEAVLAFRDVNTGVSTQAGVPAGAAMSGAQPSLLVWGRIAPDGVVLEPSFEIVTTPQMPAGGGRYRLTGADEAGRTVLDISFDGYEVDHLPDVRLFAYAIPLSAMGGRAPARIRVQGRGADEERRQSAGAPGDVRLSRDGAGRVRLQWNAARAPVLMVRDGRTGEILSFARGGDAHVTTSAAEVEINMSDGVRSTMRRVAVPR